MRSPAALLLLVTALASCRPWGDRQDAAQSGAIAAPGEGNGRVGDPVKRGAEKVTAETLPSDVAVAQPANSALSPESPGITHIPEALQGRWGLVPGDCDPSTGAAKGMLTVDDNRLVFYESKGTLTKILAATPSRITARFAFTGEGMTWDRTTTLEGRGGKLRRTETGGEEGPIDLTYSRCPQ